MASIRRKNGKWQSVVRRSGEATITRTFLSKSDARKWASRVEQGLDKRISGVVDRQVLNIPLRAYLERYKEEVSAFKASHNVEKYIIGKWQRHSLAKLAIGAITTDKLVPILLDYRIRFKPETVRKDFGILRHLFNVAIEQWRIPLIANPVQSLKLPSTAQHAVRRLPRHAWAAFEDAYKNKPKPMIFWMAVVALETAMRRSELLRMEWADIDRSRCFLTVKQGKNGYSRTVPLTKACLEALDNIKGQDARVFGMTPSGVANAWVVLRGRAGYPNIRFHDLRHEAISRLFEKGLTVPEVAAISGHRTPSQLFRYAHADLTAIRLKLAD